MSEHVLLNHHDHLDVKILSHHSPELEEKTNFTMVFPIEFRDIQSQYPIFFQKNTETGAFYPIALFGLEPGENLFLSDRGWDASYIPLMIRKQPFFIGLKHDESAQDGRSMVVTMDPSSPRISTVDGESLFNADGSATEFLNEKMSVLEHVHQGHEHSDEFVQALSEHNLLEQFVLELTMEDGSTNQMLGFYTVKEESVQALSGDVLADFSAKGFLMPLFMVLASHANVRALIQKKTGV